MKAQKVLLMTLIAVVLSLALGAHRLDAAEEESAPRQRLTVAVLDFQTKGREVADLGAKIADLMTVFMSTRPNLQLVERKELKKILAEMELGASGIVSGDKATRIGGLVGAQVLVTGRAFVLDGKLYVVGKAISVETSRMSAKMAKGPLDEDMEGILMPLSEQIGTYLQENAAKMVADIATPQDKVQALRAQIDTEEEPLPVTTARVLERHVGQQTVDPAAETELVHLMRSVGIRVLRGRELHLSDWAKQYLEDADVPLPSAADKADVVWVGEGFSEFAGRRGNLISVKARVEMQAIDRSTGEVLAIGRKTVTHVDLSEQVAGKTALQKAAGELTVEMLPKVVGEWRKLQENK